MKFYLYGHPNTLATHKTTLEFTKDESLSVEGDCILGVNADFKKSDVNKVLKENIVRVTLSIGKLNDSFFVKVNKKFSDNKEIVLRKSNFLSGRTLGIEAEKAAKDIDRRIVQKMKFSSTKMSVVISPVEVKAVILDFDDTLYDYTTAALKTSEELGEYFAKKYGVKKEKYIKVMDDIDTYYTHHSKSPIDFDRHTWYTDCFEKLGLKKDPKEIERLVKRYWEITGKHSKLFPHVKETLRKIKKKVIVMSDSDGERSIKIRRVKKLGIYKNIDFLFTADLTGVNKPSVKNLLYILKKLKVHPYECIFVGDKPEMDLEVPKTIGMRTIWMKHGKWAEEASRNHYDYIDHVITDFRKLLKYV